MANVTVTKFYLPEMIDAFLSETRRGTVLDNRIADLACWMAKFHDVERRPEESDGEYGTRAWAFLLPTAQTAGLVFRRRYGWTEDEIKEIARLLAVCREGLLALADDPRTDILRPTISLETLRRDAEVLEKLRAEWMAVLQ